MKCAHCLLLVTVVPPAGKQRNVEAKDLTAVPEEVTRIRGTALCAKHAVQKMSQPSVQAEMGIVPPGSA